MRNVARKFYWPGHDLTAHTQAALSGKTLCRISGNRTSGPGLSSGADGGLYQINKPNAGGRVFGVVQNDVDSGKPVGVLRSGVIGVLAAEALSAFQVVQTDANGKLVGHTDGIAIGVVFTAAAQDTEAEFQLFESQIEGPGGGLQTAPDVTDLTDSTTGSADDTLAAIPDPADTPATADALRDDLVTNVLPAVRNDFADLAGKTNEILAALRTAGILV